MMSSHIILFGDSIFDNAPYVPKGGTVTDHLRKNLRKHDQATLRAVDGDVTNDVHKQMLNLPIDVTHYALSVGGNDALGGVGKLMGPVTSMPEALGRLLEMRERFHHDYSAVLDRLQSHLLPIAVCTIYDKVPGWDPALLGALSYFNDVVTREAETRNLYLIDLRVRCNEASDYSQVSPIEPSSSGGEKIANALAHFVAVTG